MIEKYRGLDLNLFIVFNALLTHRNVSRAARDLGRSQSAISHALGRLRAYFGDELFVKTQDGVLPTERALELSEAVGAFVAHADTALLRAVPFDPTTARRQINLGLWDTGELATLVPLLDALRVKAPNCTIYSRPYTGDALEQALASGTLDLVLSAPVALSANILQQKLYDHRFVVIVSNDCPLEGPITAHQFSKQKEIIAIPSPLLKPRLAEAMEALGITRNIAVTTHHNLILPHIVGSNSEYIALVAHRVAHAYKETFGLKILETAFEIPRVPICQYFHRRVKNDPFSIWLRRLVCRTMAQRPELHFGPDNSFAAQGG
ncbi:LysR family transcriptional regulator [Rhizorhapis suberifaciens]|uniref:DNA-binding transcriptional LysR family regulator n=1 Tax=Rhizorhapis suberifaciens TaxID=13656 RepID=A0A840HR28_9SPHN|nr:LysR family transcriptional regulator [Rhizorhapis suberifaciens]MBB4640542.1 DNA-binding transcriptional LysR family regulator [Rhizorhapis suberifaciens]